MDGFTVLATNEVMRVANPTWIAIIAAALVVTTFLIIGAFILVCNYCITGGWITFVIAVLIGTSLGILRLTEPPSIYTPITQYKGTISDDMPYKEFVERYNVINQDGEIYTVELKENN